MSEFDSIFFDFDGVLVDSEPVHCACWAEVLKPMGVVLEWEVYRDHYIGIDDRDMLRALAAAAVPPCEWQVLWEQYPKKKELFRSRMLEAPRFPETLAGLLEWLAERFRLAVVSSSSLFEIEPLLEGAGLRGYFQTIVGGGDVLRQKPHPDPYLLAAQRLGSQKALVLEDSAAGMASGRAAGFEVIAVPHPTEVPRLLRGRLGIA
jgi:HAD superfamily hydrolase (TIGR01509 family)